MKKILSFIIPAVLILSLCACSGKIVDIEALEKEIISEVSFDTELREASANTVAAIFAPTDDVALKMYKGSSVCPDRFLIFTLSENADKDAVEKMVGEYLKKLISDYGSYAPDEVPKLENAITASAENCYLLIITSDTENARKIVDKYM